MSNKVVDGGVAGQRIQAKLQVGQEERPSREGTATETKGLIKTQWMAAAEGKHEEQRGQRLSCIFKVKEKRKLLLRSGLIKAKIPESLNYVSAPQTLLGRAKY